MSVPGLKSPQQLCLWFPSSPPSVSSLLGGALSLPLPLPLSFWQITARNATSRRCAPVLHLIGPRRSASLSTRRQGNLTVKPEACEAGGSRLPAGWAPPIRAWRCTTRSLSPTGLLVAQTLPGPTTYGCRRGTGRANGCELTGTVPEALETL